MQEEFSWNHPNGMSVTRLSPERAKHLYDGHEVASHTLTHPYMHELSDAELYQQLKAKGILVRYFDTPRLSPYVRITIGTRQEMETLLGAVERILEERK